MAGAGSPSTVSIAVTEFSEHVVQMLSLPFPVNTLYTETCSFLHFIQNTSHTPTSSFARNTREVAFLVTSHDLVIDHITSLRLKINRNGNKNVLPFY